MNHPGEQWGRQKNDKKLQMYIRDQENTVLYQPQDYTGNKFFGGWNKILNLKQNIFFENQEKYLDIYMAEQKARLELESVPACFDACIESVDTIPGLNAAQKNCLRDCYLKKISVRNDMQMYCEQKQALQNVKEMKGQFV